MGGARMTPAELKTLRESLGLSAQWVADQAGVRLRTVQYWEAGRMPVPDDVANLLTSIDRQYDQAVAITMESIEEAPDKPADVVLVRYRADADLWRFRPDMQPLPSSSHAMLLSRLRRKLWANNIPSVIEYMEPDEYLAWLGNRTDNEAERAAWAASVRRARSDRGGT